MAPWHSEQVMSVRHSLPRCPSTRWNRSPFGMVRLQRRHVFGVCAFGVCSVRFASGDCFFGWVEVIRSRFQFHRPVPAPASPRTLALVDRHRVSKRHRNFVLRDSFPDAPNTELPIVRSRFALLDELGFKPALLENPCERSLLVTTRLPL